MTPEELAELLRDPEVVRQIVALTHEPAIVNRLSEMATSETAEQKILQTLQNPEVTRQIVTVLQQSEPYRQLLETAQTMMWWMAVPLGISVVTLLLVGWNTALLRRLLRDRR